MPIAISTLRKVTIDFTNRGPGLHPGLQEATNLIEANRGGHLLLNVKVAAGILPVVMDTASLYILGFQCNTGWKRFSDADWPFSDAVTSLGYDGQYDTLGGLDGSLTIGSIGGIGKLLNAANQHQWKEPLLTLLVVVAENLRLTPVRMRVLGLMNGIFHSISLPEVSRYIKNWGQASGGKDMSVQVAPNHWQGFTDPTLIRR